MSNYYKVGCRWSHDGEDETQIQDVFQNYQAIFIGGDRDTSLLNGVKPNDRVAIADGKTIVGLALVKSEKEDLEGMKIPKEFHNTSLIFNHQHNLKHALGFRALVVLFDEQDFKKYENIGSFRVIQDTDIITHLEQMLKKYHMV